MPSVCILQHFASLQNTISFLLFTFLPTTTLSCSSEEALLLPRFITPCSSLTLSFLVSPDLAPWILHFHFSLWKILFLLLTNIFRWFPCIKCLLPFLFLKLLCFCSAFIYSHTSGQSFSIVWNMIKLKWLGKQNRYYPLLFIPVSKDS